MKILILFNRETDLTLFFGDILPQSTKSTKFNIIFLLKWIGINAATCILITCLKYQGYLFALGLITMHFQTSFFIILNY